MYVCMLILLAKHDVVRIKFYSPQALKKGFSTTYNKRVSAVIIVL